MPCNVERRQIKGRFMSIIMNRACFNYSHPAAFEVCFSSQEIICLLYFFPEQISTDRISFFFFPYLIVSLAVNKMQQREPNYQLCLPMFSKALGKNLFDLFPRDARHPHAARAGDARASRE